MSHEWNEWVNGATNWMTRNKLGNWWNEMNQSRRQKAKLKSEWRMKTEIRLPQCLIDGMNDCLQFDEWPNKAWEERRQACSLINNK